MENESYNSLNTSSESNIETIINKLGNDLFMPNLKIFPKGRAAALNQLNADEIRALLKYIKKE